MSRAVRRAADHLGERLAVLQQINDLAPGRVPPEVEVRAAATAQRSAGRIGHGFGHTVVALAGATGSGKSSMFNALAGESIAATGVRRPTTSVTEAAAFAADGTLHADTAELLDWLDVRQHHVVASGDLDGLILLDLPDHDSTQLAHRQEVDRLVRVVDVFVWVVDPQKYADAVLHRDYLQRFAGHAAVTVVVLNQIDTLPAEHRQAALNDLSRLLGADGLRVAKPGFVAAVAGKSDGVRVMAASALTGEGVDALRREIAAKLSEQRAVVARLDADLDWIADDLSGALGSGPVGDVPAAARERLAVALAGAANADVVAGAVEAAHRRRGAQIAGWPPTRWLTRLKPDPLRRLGLRGETTPPAPGDIAVARTSLPPPSTVAVAAVSTALRAVATESTSGLPELWTARVTKVANARRADLDDALDRAVGTTELPMQRPAWWTPAGWAQRLLAAVMVAGLLWLLVLFVIGWFKLPDPPTPELGAIPLPALMAIGGTVLGLLLAAIARRATVVGGRRRAAKARRELEHAAAGVGQTLVIDPVNAELAAFARLRQLIADLRR